MYGSIKLICLNGLKDVQAITNNNKGTIYNMSLAIISSIIIFS